MKAKVGESHGTVGVYVGNRAVVKNGYCALLNFRDPPDLYCAALEGQRPEMSSRSVVYSVHISIVDYVTVEWTDEAANN